MAIPTRVPRLYKPSGPTPDGSAIPITTVAALPSAGSVPGQLRQLSDANNIIVQSLGGIWRPYGGSQVLAMRGINPVTVQNTSGATAETIGPFPGGLVRAGMRLDMHAVFGIAAVGSNNRRIDLLVGNGSPTNIFANGNYNVNLTNGMIVFLRSLSVISDGSANHLGDISSGASFVQAGGYVGATGPLVDFSQPWSMGLFLYSCAETAVNITSASWAAGIATYGTSAVHTLDVGDKTVIAGITPSGYNVAAGAIVLSVPTTTSLTIAIASDPGAYTSGGTSSRISNMISQSYVLTLKG